MNAAPETRARAVASGAAYGMLIAAVLAPLDFAELLLRSRFAAKSEVLLLGAASFSTLLVTGAVLGAAGVAWSRGMRRVAGERQLLRSVLLAMPLAAPALWILGRWLSTEWLGLAGRDRILGVVGLVVIPVASLLVAWLLALSPRKSASARLRVLVVVAAVLGALVALVADRTLKSLHDEHRYVLGIHATLACAVAVQWIGRSLHRSFAHERATLTVAGVATALLVTLEAFDVRSAAATDSLLYGKLVMALRRASDFDRDGSSSLFSGRDCRAFDAGFAPSRPDVPGNGLDENCSGSDARRMPERPKAPYPIPDARGFNVVWISIDSLRADHVSAYGYSRETTPNIDRLAQGGIRFARAHMQATGTWDSVPSMLTGRYPHNLPRDYQHPRARRGKRWYAYTLGPEAPMLSDLLGKAGYATGGFTGFRMFDTIAFDGHFGTYERTSALSEAGVRFVENAKEPFLLWQHMPHPHEPYVPHAGFAFGGNTLGRYDSEIAFSDSIVGDFVKALERRGVFERTIFVVTADHGEAFGEHGNTFHGRSCYEEQMRVPLVLRVPGLGGRVVEAPVELVSVLPTLLELLRIPKDSLRLDGESLLAGLADPERLRARGAYCEYVRFGVTLQAIATDDFKLVTDFERDRVELYEKTRDPGELLNVEGREPAVRERLLEESSRRMLPR